MADLQNTVGSAYKPKVNVDNSLEAIIMAPQPMALGYLRTDGGSYPERGLSDKQVSFRRRAIEARAIESGLTLKGLYVEDTPGSRLILSRLFAAACFYVASDEALDSVIVFDATDLGVTGTAQAQTRERIEDLGLRLEIVFLG